MTDLSLVDRFVRSGPVTVIRWLPQTDTYSDPTPALFMQVLDNVVAWYPAFATNATGEIARRVVQLGPDSLRIDLDTQTPTSAVLRRPGPAELAQAQQWLQGKAQGQMQAAVQEFLNQWRMRGPLPKRDKAFQISYWLAHDFRLGHDVPAGIVIPTSDNTSLEWIALPGWEPYAYTRSRAVGIVADPIGMMVSIAEQPGQNHSISYPEYVRAADREDAITIGMNRQAAALAANISGKKDVGV